VAPVGSATWHRWAHVRWFFNICGTTWWRGTIQFLPRVNFLLGQLPSQLLSSFGPFMGCHVHAWLCLTDYVSPPWLCLTDQGPNRCVPRVPPKPTRICHVVSSGQLKLLTYLHLVSLVYTRLYSYPQVAPKWLYGPTRKFCFAEYFFSIFIQYLPWSKNYEIFIKNPKIQVQYYGYLNPYFTPEFLGQKSIFEYDLFFLNIILIITPYLCQ
jgi:hypothetical protein